MQAEWGKCLTRHEWRISKASAWAGTLGNYGGGRLIVDNGNTVDRQVWREVVRTVVANRWSGRGLITVYIHGKWWRPYHHRLHRHRRRSGHFKFYQRLACDEPRQFGLFDCPAVTSIIIPNSVRNIGAGVFDYCGLTNLVIPDSVVRVFPSIM